MPIRTKRVNTPVTEMQLEAFKCAAWRGQQSLADFMRTSAERQLTPEDWALAANKLAKGRSR